MMTGTVKRAAAPVALCAAFLLAACRAPGGASALAGATSAGAAPPAQELVIGEQFDLGGAAPTLGMLDDAQVLVYETLVGLDADFRQTPALAESWEMSGDGTVWTFNLRRGVTFHDGEEWNAAAAAANLERLAGDYTALEIDRIEASGYTLTLSLASPCFTVPSELARTTMSMVSPAALGGGGLDAEAAAGTGPYRLASWTPDAEYSFEANDGYWGGAPNLRRITYKVITDPQARALALESGEIDMMSGYQSLAAVKRFAADARFNVIQKTQNTSAAVFFNMRREPLNSLAVRRAVGMALPMGELVTNLLGGLASPPSGFFSPAYGALVSPNANMPACDPAAAAAELLADGWAKGEDGFYARDGARLSLGLTYSAANSEDSLLAPAMQSALREFGIDVTITAVEGAAMDAVLEGRDYDMVLTGQSFIPTDEPSFNYSGGYWHSKSYYNIYSTPALDAMIDALRAEPDADARVRLHHRIQEAVMDAAPMFIAYHRNSVRVAAAKVTNFDIGAGCWHVNVALKDAVIE